MVTVLNSHLKYCRPTIHFFISLYSGETPGPQAVAKQHPWLTLSALTCNAWLNKHFSSIYSFEESVLFLSVSLLREFAEVAGRGSRNAVSANRWPDRSSVFLNQPVPICRLESLWVPLLRTAAVPQMELFRVSGRCVTRWAKGSLAMKSRAKMASAGICFPSIFPCLPTAFPDSFTTGASSHMGLILDNFKQKCLCHAIFFF